MQEIQKNPVLSSSGLLAVALFFGVVLWLVSGIFLPSGHKDENAKKDETPLSARVRVMDSVAQEIAPRITITGHTVPYAQIEVRAEVDGRITALPADEGQAVKAGDLLAQIEPLDRAERAVEAKQRFVQREIEYKAAKNLANQGFASEVRLAESRANLEAARAEAEAARLTLAKTQVNAPFAGVVAQRLVDEGAYVVSGQVLFSLVALDPIVVEGFVSEQNIGALREGQEVMIRLLDGQEVKGTLTFLSPVAEQGARTFRLEARAANPNNAIKGGLTATLQILGAPILAHKISSAILTLNDEGHLGVRVMQDGRVAFFAITVVLEEEGVTWIAGLPDKVQIITVGQEFVKAQERAQVEIETKIQTPPKPH